MNRLYVETEQGTLIEICTCRDNENVMRIIIESYETIWENLYNRPIGWLKAEKYGSSIDPIIQNWGGSEIVVEAIETGDRNYWNHG